MPNKLLNIVLVLTINKFSYAQGVKSLSPANEILKKEIDKKGIEYSNFTNKIQFKELKKKQLE